MCLGGGMGEKLNKEIIDLKADYYKENSVLQKSLSEEVISTCQIKDTDRVLDLGCGDGRTTAEIAKAANKGTVVGLDSSPSMIEFAKKQFPSTENANLSFIEKGAEYIDYVNEFDLIVSFSCFHWLKEPEKVFHRLNKALKENGRIVVLTYPKESPYYQYLEKALEKYPEYQSLSAYHTMLSVQDYQDYFIKNNLNITAFRKCDLVASYKNLDEVKDFIEGWLNSYVPLPEELHQKFLEDICEAVIADPKTRVKNGWGLPYTALIVEAKKSE